MIFLTAHPSHGNPDLGRIWLIIIAELDHCVLRNTMQCLAQTEIRKKNENTAKKQYSRLIDNQSMQLIRKEGSELYRSAPSFWQDKSLPLT